jgi:RNA polymerase sigma-70 factor (ECF subfamily)
MSRDPSQAELVRLIRRAQSGEREALDSLFRRYQNYIGLLAQQQVGRHLRGEVSPSDVVQETLLRAGKYLHQFRGSSDLELMSWLRRNLASTMARLVRFHSAQRRDYRLQRQLDAELDASSIALAGALQGAESTPSQQAIAREEAIALADAIAGLKSDYRQAIILRHLEGLSFAEVAQRMGRSVDSVKKLWLRGLAEVRDTVGDK